MGLFSSKKKTRVGTQVQRAIEDNMLPESIKASVMRAIMSNKEEASIPEHMINGFANSVALKVDRLMGYAASGYSYGRPKRHAVARSTGQSIVKTVLENTLGHAIVVEHYEFAPINPLHVGWKILVDDYGYNVATNEIATLSGTTGFPTYLKDIRAVYTTDSFAERDLAATDQWGVSPASGFTPERPAGLAIGKYAFRSSVIEDQQAVEDTVEIVYVYKNGAGTVIETTLELSMAAYDEDAEYHHVRYRHTVGAAEHTVFWLYQNGEGTYPTIDNIQDITFDGLGTYFPFVHFRRDKVDMTNPALTGTPDFDTSVKLLDFFGMDFQEIGEAIHENPDIDAVEQAMLVMAISADDPSEIGQAYLFDHFNALWATGVGRIEHGDQAQRGHAFAEVIADREFRMTFRHAGISKRRRGGQIAVVGGHGHAEIPLVDSETRDVRAFGVTVSTPTSSPNMALVYRRQINDNLYDEITIYRPELVYHIYGDKAHVAAYGADALIIPIDHALIGGYSLPDREILLARSMHFVFNTRVTTKVKWYQSGIFKALLIVVAIVIMVYTGLELYTAVVAALEVGALAAAQVILTYIVTGLVIAEVSQLIISQIGGEYALILAAVAAVVALGYSPGSIASVKGAPWAQDLLMAASGMARAVQVNTEELIEDLQKEFLEFQDIAEQKMDLLEEANALLETESLINPIEFVGLAPFSIEGEKPQEYYDRTVHSGNVGVKSLNAISEYVGAALTLPKLNDTLRSDFNEI